MEEYVLICEDSVDGILTGIFDAYQLKKEEGIESHDFIHLDTKEPEIGRLFTHYEKVQTDLTKAQKVLATLNEQLGSDTYYHLYQAMVSHFEDKADAVYHTVVSGLTNHDKNVFMRLHEDYVCRAFKYANQVGKEAHFHVEFLRFDELTSGILFAKIAPKSNVLALVVPHFADRLPSEDFVIYDEKRQIYALHPKRKQWYMVSGAQIDENEFVFTRENEMYAELFTRFCETITIEERRNPKLQMNMLPLRYRPYMTEFKNESIHPHANFQ